MTDDLEKLRRTLSENPPPAADGPARARALAAALAAYDEAAAGRAAAPAEAGRDAVDSEASGNPAHARPTVGEMRPGGHQENARPMRPSDRRSRLTLMGRLRMTATRLPSGRTLMLGTASAAVLMLAVVTTGSLIELGPVAPLPRLAEPERTVSNTGLGPAEPALRDDATKLATAPERQESEEALAAAPSLTPPPPPSTVAPRPAPLSAPAATDGDAALGDAVAQDEMRLAAPGAVQPRAGVAAPQSAAGAGQLPAGPAPTAGPVIGFRGDFGAPSGIAPQSGAAPGIVAEPLPPIAWQEQGRDRFADIEPNDVKVTAEEPVSTFSIDVDTASYSFVRKALMQGVLPPKDAVRVEELVNYFPYDYAPPESRETPFASHVAVMPTPWNEDTKLLRIGIQGYDIVPAERPRANLVFLIDTSGSMDAPDKLPLLINSFRLLVDSLEPEDQVAIVAYAGSAGTVLEPTPVSEKSKILSALDRLWAGGSTAGGEGIRQAYRLAEAGFDPEGINRVILATDGDFNVGITSTDELQDFVERERESGIYLSVLGFGRGNFNDELMQALAQNGNGQAAYIDTLSEARKTLVDEASSTLFPIANDVKIQVEFNPATVAEYRLIGYETRLLAREDFNNDKVDAGEIGAGHSVTALYEITPAGSDARQVDALRYGQAESAPAAPAAESAAGGEVGDPASDEYAFLKIRYKLPGEGDSRLITRPVTPADEHSADADARFAAAVAAFGQLLRGGEHLGDFGYDDVVSLANAARGEDPWGYRAEFVTLARLAASAAALEPQRP